MSQIVATAEISPRAGKYITFQLSRHYFAIPSERVRQILPASDVRPGDNDVPHVSGTIPANGRLIPVVDLRQKLGLTGSPSRPSACVLVVTLGPDCPVRLVGLVADRLSEIVEYRASEIRGMTAQQRIDGRPYGRPKTVLDPEQLLRPAEWSKLHAVIF